MKARGGRGPGPEPREDGGTRRAVRGGVRPWGPCTLPSPAPGEGTGARGGQTGCSAETTLGRRTDEAWVSGDHVPTLGAAAEGAGVGAEAEGRQSILCA